MNECILNELDTVDMLSPLKLQGEVVYGIDKLVKIS